MQARLKDVLSRRYQRQFITLDSAAIYVVVFKQGRRISLLRIVSPQWIPVYLFTN